MGEKVLSKVPFVPKIESADMGFAMLNHAIDAGLKKSAETKTQTILNDDIIRYARSVREHKL